MSKPTLVKAGASNPSTQSFAPVRSIRPVVRPQSIVDEAHAKDAMARQAARNKRLKADAAADKRSKDAAIVDKAVGEAIKYK